MSIERPMASSSEWMSFCHGLAPHQTPQDGSRISLTPHPGRGDGPDGPDGVGTGIARPSSDGYCNGEAEGSSCTLTGRIAAWPHAVANSVAAHRAAPNLPVRRRSPLGRDRHAPPVFTEPLFPRIHNWLPHARIHSH
ncbi:hypothetical protein GCM10022205_04530 [Spinactinospora alkalitolerans]